MSEISRPWSGSSTGDAGAYTDEHWRDVWEDAFANNDGDVGVIPGVGSELAVTNSTSPVSVAAGSAFVKGCWYRSTAGTNVTIPTPASSTRDDVIVLRMDWTAQAIRITRIAGTEGAGAPSITQSDGATWDLKLAECSITTGGTITNTDFREFVLPGWLTGMILHITGSTVPKGFSEFTAGRGRVLVGTPSGGTHAGTVGSALTDQATRTITDVPQHTHTMQSAGSHTHGYSNWKNNSGGGWDCNGCPNGALGAATTNSSGSHSHTIDNAGSASVDVTMPYIQQLGIVKY